MNRAFISQPMTGHTPEEIADTRRRAAEQLRGWGYEVADTVFEQGDDSLDFQLRQLGGALRLMAGCRAVYFCRGWELSRGCRVEHEAALMYGRRILYEEEQDGKADKEDK